MLPDHINSDLDTFLGGDESGGVVSLAGAGSLSGDTSFWGDSGWGDEGGSSCVARSESGGGAGRRGVFFFFFSSAGDLARLDRNEEGERLGSCDLLSLGARSDFLAILLKMTK